MNEELPLDLEIVELGDAKEGTKGLLMGQENEEVPGKPYAWPL